MSEVKELHRQYGYFDGLTLGLSLSSVLSVLAGFGFVLTGSSERLASSNVGRFVAVTGGIGMTFFVLAASSVVSIFSFWDGFIVLVVFAAFAFAMIILMWKSS